MGKTLTEKLIAAHLVSGSMEPGAEVALRIDQTLTQDATGTMAYLEFESMGIDRVKTKRSVAYIDHNTLQSGFENADDHRYIQSVAAKHGIWFSRPGNGICHQVHLERFGVPGQTLIGSDSHTPTGGGIGMLAFGINFNLYYFLLMRRFRDVAKSEELWAYLGIVAFSPVTIAANIRHLYGAVGTSLRHAFFQVSSIITTTGYATVDFDQWPGYAKTVLVLLMFVGGCAGSTGGGLKVTRVVTLVKAAFMDMRKMIHPNAVVNVRMEGRAMPEKQVRGVQAYFSVYMLLYAVSWLLLSLNGFDLLSTFTALSACINNIGPGLGMVGPTGNFSAFAPWAKLLLSFDMLAGRLEIFPMLLLFVPSTWRGNRLRRWERRN